MFPALDLNVEPSEGDKLILGNTEWVVKAVLSDPMPALYELQVRPRNITP